MDAKRERLLSSQIEALQRRLDMRVRTGILSAKEGDVVVVQSDTGVTDEDVAAIRASFHRAGFKRLHVLYLAPDVKLRVLSKAERVALIEKLKLPARARRRKR